MTAQNYFDPMFGVRSVVLLIGLKNNFFIPDIPQIEK